MSCRATTKCNTPKNFTLHCIFPTPHSPLHSPHSTPGSHSWHARRRSPLPRPALCTSHFTLHISPCTLPTPHPTLHTPHSRPYTPHSMLHTLCRTLDPTIPISRSALPSTVHVPPSALHTLHSTPWAAKYGAHSTLYVALLKLDALHPSLPTLYFFTLPTPHFLHYILHFATLCALHYSADSAANTGRIHKTIAVANCLRVRGFDQVLFFPAQRTWNFGAFYFMFTKSLCWQGNSYVKTALVCFLGSCDGRLMSLCGLEERKGGWTC